MSIISLNEFYEKLKYHAFDDAIYVEKPYGVGDFFKIIEVVWRSDNRIVVLARDEGKLVALRMGDRKEDFASKLSTIKMEMNEDYRKYLLELQYPSVPIKTFKIGQGQEAETISFDQMIHMTVWDAAEATLEEKLSSSFETKREWFIQFLKGLGVIHSRGRIHFDIKLGNLFIVKSQLKIGDFDYYLKKEEFLESSVLVCGSPGHIAPEMFLDRNQVSGKCDIFSAGVAFCQLFTESYPPSDLYHNGPLTVQEKEEFSKLFNDKQLLIKKEDLYKLFIRNFRVFRFFLGELIEKLNSNKITKAERFIFMLLREMIEIEPGNRINTGDLLFRIHEKIFVPESLLGKELLNRYKVQELIDKGGRGIVYRVLDNKTGLDQAIKLFPPQFNFIKKGFEQIRQELIDSQKISHKNVVRVNSLECDGELNFLVMEFIDGYNLKRKLDHSKKLNEPSALNIMKQVASGLLEAHRNGVIHRNLKDQNIMVTADGQVAKIINFGLSLDIKKEISKTSGEELFSQQSILFSPPEKLKGIFTENEQTDIWSFGAILYQLLTGKAPFAENDTIRDSANLPRIKGVSGKTKSVVSKCLANDQKKRYWNMKEVYDDLFEEKRPGRGNASEPKRSFLPGYKRLIAFVAFICIAAILIIWGNTVFNNGETYKMFYYGTPGGENIPGGAIGSAISTDGIQWQRQKNNPIIPAGRKGVFNEFASSLPYICHDGTTFHMFFLGRGGDLGQASQIGYVTSTNGSDWNSKAIETVALDNGNITSPGPLLYENGIYKMWYSKDGDVFYAQTPRKGSSILSMTTLEKGPVLEKGKEGQWDCDDIRPGSVLYEAGIYRMWFTGRAGEESKIGYATSGNGIYWNKHPVPVFNDPDVSREMNPFVLKVSDTQSYLMYYTAENDGREYAPVLLARSSDGIQWGKYSDDPVLNTGPDNWEKTKIFVTSVEIKSKK